MSVPNGTDHGHALEQTVTRGTANFPPVSHVRRASANYTMISNGVGRDSRLTGNAVFVFLNVCGHAEGYGISVTAIQHQTGLGKDAVQAAMRRLGELGYLLRERVRQPNGTFVYTYFTDDQPAGSPQNPRSAPVTENPALAPTSDDPETRTSGPVPGYPAPAEPVLDNTPTKKTNEEDQQTQDSNPTPALPSSARSAGDVPKGPHVGDARGTGGCAAPAKRDATKLDPKRARRARAVLTSTAVIAAILPSRIPRVLVAEVARQLDGRTEHQIVARVERRWNEHGYANAAAAGTLGKPVGVAFALVRAGECPDPSCEDGVMIDTGLPCRCCAERRGDRRRNHDAADRSGADAAGAAPDVTGATVAGEQGPDAPTPPDWFADAPQDAARADARRALLDFVGDAPAGEVT